ncbi:MAG: hypothetical protein ACPGJS_03810 [Flammeovirgaceae bacterium]
MMRTLTLFLLFTLVGSQLQAQDLTKLIPNDAVAVLAINADSYSKKIDMDKVMELDVMKAFDEQMKKEMRDSYDLVSLIYKDPKAVGVNLNPKAYAYVQAMDSLFFGAFISNISDKKKFEDFINNLPMVDAGQIKKGKGYKYVTIETGSIAWTNSVVMLSGVEGEQKGLYEGLDYDDENYYDQLEARRKAFDESKLAVLAQKRDMIVSVNSSLKDHANFVDFNKSAYDAGVWLNLSPLSDILQRAQGNSPMLATQAQMLESMSELWEDTYYHSLLTFDAGEVNLIQRSYMNDRLFNLYKDIYDKKVQPKMLNYVNGSNLLGFGVIAVDIKKLFSATIEVYKPMLDQLPQMSGGKAEAMLDLLGIALDEDALANIIDGEILLAVTDFKEVEMTYIDYEYDDDYNLKKIEKTRKQQMPLVVGELGIGNKENFMKLINALESYQILSVKDNIYSLRIPNSSLDVKLALLDDIAIITNDADLLENGLAKGVKKKNQINAALKADVLKHNQYFYFDIQNIISAAMKANKYMSNSEKEAMTMMQEKFDDMRLMGIETGNKMFTYRFKMTMTDKKTNSGMQLYQIANDIYLQEQAGKSEEPVIKEEKKN